MSIDLTDPIFNDEDAAWRHFESIRWPDGPVCPHCGIIDSADKIIGKTARAGLYRCRECVKQFTATIGTVYEDSHIPMHKWLLATHLLCASKKGYSAHQLMRTLGLGSYRTAWFMAHRIRETMRSSDLTPMGGAGAIVEADETFIGRKEGFIKRRGHGHKNAMLSRVDRESGQVRSFHIDGTSAADILPIVEANVAKETAMMTDEGGHYFTLGEHFASHESISHKADEYVRGDVHTNTVEGYYSIFKRMKGVYQQCSEKHLHRYIAEFDFRYNHRSRLGIEDAERAARALKGVEGKRLTYRQPREATRA
jgi:transposase-like protein